MKKQYGVTWNNGYDIYTLEDGEIGDYGNFTFQEAKQWIKERLQSDIDQAKYQLIELKSLKEKDL